MIICSLSGIALIFISVLTLMEMTTTRKAYASLDEKAAVNTICELATLRCYYHNVAVFEKKPDFIFQYGLAQYGYKKLWLEYSGIVEYAVDAGLIRISEPDADGVVSVYVPEASVKNVTADKNSMAEPLTETGMFTDISAEDHATAFSEAQKHMKEEAENDSAQLARAHENACKLLEQYIVETGKAMGTEYKIKWVDS
jgi:hypothetical protein